MHARQLLNCQLACATEQWCQGQVLLKARGRLGYDTSLQLSLLAGQRKLEVPAVPAPVHPFWGYQCGGLGGCLLMQHIQLVDMHPPLQGLPLHFADVAGRFELGSEEGRLKAIWRRTVSLSEHIT